MALLTLLASRKPTANDLKHLRHDRFADVVQYYALFSKLEQYRTHRPEAFMKRIVRVVWLLLALTCCGIVAFAQNNGGDAAGAACSLLACGGFGIFYLLILAVSIAIPVVIIVVIVKFIRKDAVSRGMPNADSIKWLGLLGVLGLVIYLLQRPQVMVLPCPHCGQSRMQGLPTCPHCGNA